MRRSFARSVARMLVGVVLLAQLAVSAYACPGLTAAKVQMSPDAMQGDQSSSPQGATVQPMANCEDMAGAMDPSFANLCAEHCHQGQQSDQAATVSVPAALLNALYVTPLAPEPTAAPRPAADATSALVAASPPHAILHCCFRI
ncbi:hypothetical protein [Methylibium sp.]|uniref:hypothetical protein n=1 Tax=Methylibium sp. TaxID=2067992 RepID=UPI003D0E1393